MCKANSDKDIKQLDEAIAILNAKLLDVSFRGISRKIRYNHMESGSDHNMLSIAVNNGEPDAADISLMASGGNNESSNGRKEPEIKDIIDSLEKLHGLRMKWRSERRELWKVFWKWAGIAIAAIGIGIASVMIIDISLFVASIKDALAYLKNLDSCLGEADIMKYLCDILKNSVDAVCSNGG